MRGVVYRSLLKRLKLSSNLNKKVDLLMANAIRLDWISYRLFLQDNTIAALMAKRVIQSTLKNIPDYLERNSKNLSSKEKSQIKVSYVDLLALFKKIGKPASTESIDPSSFIELAVKVNDDALRYHLGEKKLKILQKGLKKTVLVSQKMFADDTVK